MRSPRWWRQGPISDTSTLGPRLRDCARILTDLSQATAVDILGGVDAMKLRSSMTLFARAAPEQQLFGAVLERYFDGDGDAATERCLDSAR